VIQRFTAAQTARVFAQVRVAAAMAVAALLPSVAWACPACAGRDDGNAAVYLLFSMIFLPFAVSGVVIAVLRKTEARASDEELTS
jgi:hypothetical protein